MKSIVVVLFALGVLTTGVRAQEPDYVVLPSPPTDGPELGGRGGVRMAVMELHRLLKNKPAYAVRHCKREYDGVVIPYRDGWDCVRGRKVFHIGELGDEVQGATLFVKLSVDALTDFFGEPSEVQDTGTAVMYHWARCGIRYMYVERQNDKPFFWVQFEPRSIAYCNN